MEHAGEYIRERELPDKGDPKRILLEPNRTFKV